MHIHTVETTPNDNPALNLLFSWIHYNDHPVFDELMMSNNMGTSDGFLEVQHMIDALEASTDIPAEIGLSACLALRDLPPTPPYIYVCY